jgi:hypothetical protein
MSASFAPSREHALRQTLRLVDLGCDLERNLSDGDFTKDDRHEIIPVFDENIFEMFVTPKRFREASETFYADLWSNPGQSRELSRSFETQSALLTAEYLLTRTLPGARSGLINMTEFHWRELSLRLDRIQNELEERREAQPDLYGDELDRKLTALAPIVDLNKASARESEQLKGDPFLIEDLAKLAQRLDKDAVRRIAAARRTTSVLARSDLVEPIDQVIRAGSSEIFDRVRPLQDRFRPVGRELHDIDAEAEEWFGRIVEELRRPANRGRRRSQGDLGKAVWNDARTIAYLRWVIRRRLTPDQRLVFITGDVVLFDCYRRWYFDREDGETPTEPFFFRRVAQYTPLFNPNSSGGDLYDAGEGGAPTLFSLIQQGVDATLLALQRIEEKEAQADDDARLAGDPPESETTLSTAESITDARRELLALKQVDRDRLADDPALAPLVALVSSDWLENSAAISQRNRELWQEIERLSIGASFDIVYNRMSPDQRAAVSLYSDAMGEEASKILLDYASAVLEKLRLNTIRIWLPLAESLLDPEFDDPSFRGPRIQRVSVAIMLPGPDASEDPAIVAQRPEIVFARAAIKALEMQDVATLARFAGHALKASELNKAASPSAESIELELKYLNAVAQRLSIASVQAHLHSTERSEVVRERSGFRAIEQIKTMYGRASVLLQECIAVHYLLADKEASQAIRYLRSLSERASLHLFTATSFALAAKRHHALLLGDAQHYLALAEGDLKRCIEFDAHNEISDPLIDLVRAQFIPNIAGYEVLSFLLSTDERKYVPRVWRSDAKKRLLAFWQTETQAHPLLTAELFGYGLLLDVAPPPGRTLDRRALRRSMTKLRLPLDRELFRAIDHQLLKDYY